MSSAEKVYGFNTPQRLFVGYTLAVLVDLVVLNLYNEFWGYVTISSFSVSLAAAMLLQLFLKLSIKAEHKAANYFKSKSGLARHCRVLCDCVYHPDCRSGGVENLFQVRRKISLSASIRAAF